MREFNENQITKLIIDSYHEKITGRIISDVLIVGAGPAGLMAGHDLAQAGFKVTFVEKRLSPGGGIWVGGMGMNDVVFQEAALPILKDLDLRCKPRDNGLYTVDAVELASGMCFKTLQAGAEILNLITLEDVSVHAERVTGVVVNRTGISGNLHVDPLTFSAKAVIDATGHVAFVLN